VLAHVRRCRYCQAGRVCVQVARLGMTRDERDAVVAFDRALNPDQQPPDVSSSRSASRTRKGAR